MPTIVDGCNILGAMGKLFRPNSDQYLLEKFILPYKEVNNKKIIVVFDNTDYNSYEKNHFSLRGVSVHYTQPNFQSADDWIIDYIKDSEHKTGITLVTSDRDLKNVALLYKCKHLYADDFIEEMKDVLIYRKKEQYKLLDEETRLLSDPEMNEINQELLGIWGEE